jgi:hypothetical protein
VITTTATTDVDPIRGTCPRCGRPTAIRPAGPLASAGPADVIRLRSVESCSCGYRQAACDEESARLEGSPGAVGEGLRALLDAPPIAAGAGFDDGGPPP